MDTKKIKIGIQHYFISFHFQLTLFLEEFGNEELYKRLQCACLNQDLTEVEELLKMGLNLNVTDNMGVTLLNMAISIRNKEIVGLFLKHGADPNKSNVIGTKIPLLEAIKNKSNDIVQILLDNGADPNRLDNETGNSALMLAIENEDKEMVKLLLDHGANPERKNNSCQFPLLQSVKKELVEIVSLLLDFKAPVDQEDRKGSFPLLKACNIANYEIAELLLKKGADPNRISTQSGSFPLYEASDFVRPQTKPKIIQLLLRYGAKVNQHHDTNGDFPLLRSVFYGLTFATKILLENGAAPNQVDFRNENFPLMETCCDGNLEVANILLSKGANPNQEQKLSGETPLSLLCGSRLSELEEEKGLQMIKLLLNHGADPNHVNPTTGQTPILEIISRRIPWAMELLLKHRANPNQENSGSGVFPLLAVSMHGSEGQARKLLKYGANPNQVNLKDGDSPLLKAIEYRRIGIVNILLNPPLPKKILLFLCCMREYCEYVDVDANADAGDDPRSDTSGLFHDNFLPRDMFYEITKQVVLLAKADRNQCRETDGMSPLALSLRIKTDSYRKDIVDLLRKSKDIAQFPRCEYCDEKIDQDTPLQCKGCEGYFHYYHTIGKCEHCNRNLPDGNIFCDSCFSDFVYKGNEDCVLCSVCKNERFCDNCFSTCNICGKYHCYNCIGKLCSSPFRSRSDSDSESESESDSTSTSSEYPPYLE